MSEKIKKGDKVSIEYTGSYDDGTIFDTNKHGDHSHPLEFIVGAGMVIPGFDSAVIGMNEGEEKKFRIEAKDAYGERDDSLVRTVPKPPTFPGEAKEGMLIGVGPSQEQQVPALIVKITQSEVTLDLNHPLAGRALNFEIKVVKIETGQEQKE